MDDPVISGDGTSQLTCGLVRFTPGARTNWHSRVNGNLKVGNTRETLLAVLTVLVPYIGCPRTLNGLAELNDITC